MFTSSIIAILTIPRAIIQSCMGGSGWFAKGTELSWISYYCISLIEIQSKLKTVSRSQAIVYGRTHGRRTSHHGISSFGLWPVELKTCKSETVKTFSPAKHTSDLPIPKKTISRSDLKTLIPDEMMELFLSQSDNIVCDPRGRRWSQKIITACLQ